MENFEIELSNGNSVGTSLRGHIVSNYQGLVKLLGEPNAENDGYKTDAEWEIMINDKVITIYNWKNGRNYLGEYGEDVEDITEWNVGGHGNIDEELNFLKNKLKYIFSNKENY